MCSVCGCNETHTHKHDHSEPTHTHHHDHHHEHDHPHHYGTGTAGLSVSGFSQERLIEIEQNILSGNDADASVNRQRLSEQGLLAFNLVSSSLSG